MSVCLLILTLLCLIMFSFDSAAVLYGSSSTNYDMWVGKTDVNGDLQWGIGQLCCLCVFIIRVFVVFVFGSRWHARRDRASVQHHAADSRQRLCNRYVCLPLCVCTCVLSVRRLCLTLCSQLARRHHSTCSVTTPMQLDLRWAARKCGSGPTALMARQMIALLTFRCHCVVADCC